MANPTTTTVAQGLTGDLLVDVMTTGYKWNLTADRTIDWAVSNGLNGEYWFDPASVQQHAAFALDVISYYCNVKFAPLGTFSNPSAAHAAGSEITISLDGTFLQNPNIWAIGHFPSTQQNPLRYTGQAGDVFLNIRSDANTLDSYDPGSIGWALLLHELGHALGLKHPHDDGGTGHPTFAGAGIAELDQSWVTVMSYKDDYNWNQLAWHPATPMVADVLALQYLYGRNETTNAGDSLFNLTSTNLYLTVWDASGTDTVSAAQATSGWTIVLPDLQLSSLVPTKVGFAVPGAELSLSSPHTFEWLTGDIENATGSSYADMIDGSAGANTIYGGAGGDTITGGDGVNMLWGDDGDDQIDGGADFDRINGNQGSDIARGAGGNDWVSGGKDQDVIFGDDGDDIVNGNIGQDTCDGGVGADIVRGGQGADLLTGSSGDDWISGDRGDDTISGGAGADIFNSFGDAGVDRILDFSRAEGDRVQLAVGTSYVVAQSGADTVINMTGGGQVILVGIAQGSLGDGWLLVA